MKILFRLGILTLTLIAHTGQSQILMAEKSFIKFYSDGIIEDITATNAKGSALLDMATGDIAFDIPINRFEFAKDLMKQHFNEKYMESEKFPKSTFTGKLIGFNSTKPGSQEVVAQGKLAIHGVTQEVSIPGTIEIQNASKATLKSKFMVKLVDYKIKIPTVVWQNIAEQVEVTVEFAMKPK